MFFAVSLLLFLIYVSALRASFTQGLLVDRLVLTVAVDLGVPAGLQVHNSHGSMFSDLRVDGFL